MNKTDLVEKAFLRTDLPEFRPGDSVKVHVRVVEGNRERLQLFQGVVIRRQGGGLRETFTVRKVSFGVGVERTFPVHSLSIAKLEVVSRGRVRRAKLYYLRDLRGRKARIRERRVDEAKLAEMEAARQALAEEVADEVADYVVEEAAESIGESIDVPETEEAPLGAADEGDAPSGEPTEAAPRGEEEAAPDALELAEDGAEG